MAVAPTGVVAAIEIKTSAYHAGHLDRVRAQAEWLAGGRRRWRRREARAVLCVGRDIERREAGVLVVLIDRLNHALRVVAG